MSDYQPNIIELKWQQQWNAENAYAVSNTSEDTESPNYYCLDMFPYPSGSGLHVGHPEGYTATDIVSRYKRMQGEHVLHPMGWDSFGLPAENYAIKTGVHPAESTAENIKTFTRQIESLGFSYDWDREITTSSPEYYKWTQWLFLELYKHGLAYRKQAKVNWCDGCQTVLANEQVVDGKCERSDDIVIQKNLEQWFFKITDYADQLLEDLDDIDWPEPIKLMQRNWIGRSEGAELDFKLAGNEAETIRVFTTRPDTLFGATYMVLAPEHELVATITTPEQQAQVEEYVTAAAKKTELQRTDLAKEKSGVFTGAYAINPATGEQIPVWVADYVLVNYGTGAIMAVPGHDVRDHEFAQQYNITITEVVQPEDTNQNNEEETAVYTGPGTLINSGEFDGMDTVEAKAAITKQVGGEMKTTYRMRDWLVSRQRYWGAPIPIVYDPEGKAHPVKAEHLPLQLPTDVDYNPKGTSPIGSSKSYVQLAEELYGEGWRFEVDTMDTFVCSSWYYLRYCDPTNTEMFADPAALEQWLPVDMYVGGAEHAVMHLLYARFFHKALQDLGHIPTSVGREPFKALRNQGMILGEDHQKMSKSKGNVINPDVVVEEYGADTLRVYEMFMGPFADVKPWDTASIKGSFRFLDKVYRLNDKVSKEVEVSEDTRRHQHATIKKVTADIESFGFNTAISTMMIYVNHLSSLTAIPQAAYETVVVLLSPFAPHITHELWEQLGHSTVVTEEQWPVAIEEYLVESEVTMVVQVNGKVRDKITVAADADEATVRAAAEASDNVQKNIAGKEIVKVIHVPNKLISFVVK